MGWIDELGEDSGDTWRDVIEEFRHRRDGVGVGRTMAGRVLFFFFLGPTNEPN
uniref:Uncharacterized protein n=1 Tax=Rhizophora mucronata TaxID=61149 RepID=A0A2P2NHE6_RHIMU